MVSTRLSTKRKEVAILQRVAIFLLFYLVDSKVFLYYLNSLPISAAQDPEDGLKC